ncbi:hypothetical protein ILUMI_09597, partial [Ignelater luminosus]
MMDIASTSTSIQIHETEQHERPKRYSLPHRRRDSNPVAVHFRSIDFNNKEEERRVRNNYIFKTFGPRKTRSQKAFVEALGKTGKFNVRLLTFYLFVVWYMIAVDLHEISIITRNSIIVRCKIPELENCLSFMEILDVSVRDKTPSYQDDISTQYCKYKIHNYEKLVIYVGCDYLRMKKVLSPRKGKEETAACSEFVVHEQTVPKMIFTERNTHVVSLREDV